MAVVLFILGTIFGSFCYVVGTRLPENESLIKPRSHCETCHLTLKWWQLIPLISFIAQRGKCYFCHCKISPAYFLIELLTGLFFVISYIRFGLTANLIIFIIISLVAIIIFVSDFKYYIILDSPTYIGGFLVVLIQAYSLGYIFACGSVIRGGILVLVALSIKLLGDFIFKKESLGGGDIKLCGFIGIVLGLKLGLLSIILASFLAFPYATFQLLSKKDHEIPFGPFIIIAVLICFFAQSSLNDFLSFLVS